SARRSRQRQHAAGARDRCRFSRPVGPSTGTKRLNALKLVLLSQRTGDVYGDIRAREPRGPNHWFGVGIKRVRSGDGFLQVGNPIVVRIAVGRQASGAVNQFPDVAHSVAVQIDGQDQTKTRETTRLEHTLKRVAKGYG